MEILKLKFTEVFDIKDLGEINHFLGMNLIVTFTVTVSVSITDCD